MAVGALAGLVDGFTRCYGLSRQWAREDEDRKTREEERAYLKEQRDRLRKEQTDQDAIDAALKGVKRSVPTYGGSIEDSDMYGPLAGDLQTTQRSQRDVLADQARAIAGIGGLRGAQLGLQFQQGVDALDETQRQRRRQDLGDARQREIDNQAGIDREARRAREAMLDRQTRVLEGMRNSRLLLSGAGDDPARLEAVARQMQSIYEGVPDGRQLVLGNGMMGLATPDGKYVYPPVPINRQNMESALEYAERYLDPNWATRRKVDDDKNYRDRLLGLQGREADREDADAPFRRGLWSAQSGYYRSGGSGSSRTDRTRIVKAEDGTQTALDATSGKPLHNILSDGTQVDVGINNTAWDKARREARTSGVRAAIGKGKDGKDRIAFVGADGKYYDTAAEAMKARAPR